MLLAKVRISNPFDYNEVTWSLGDTNFRGLAFLVQFVIRESRSFPFQVEWRQLVSLLWIYFMNLIAYLQSIRTPFYFLLYMKTWAVSWAGLTPLTYLIFKTCIMDKLIFSLVVFSVWSRLMTHFQIQMVQRKLALEKGKL